MHSLHRKPSSRVVAALTCLSALLTPMAILLAQAPSFAQSKPAAGSTAIYERAKKQLPKDIYVLYRIVDRIARANGLDERP